MPEDTFFGMATQSTLIEWWGTSSSPLMHVPVSNVGQARGGLWCVCGVPGQWQVLHWLAACG